MTLRPNHVLSFTACANCYYYLQSGQVIFRGGIFDRAA